MAPTIDLTCPFAVEALQLRLLGRLHLGAFDTALMDAKKLQKTRWIFFKDKWMGWRDGGNDGMVTSNLLFFFEDYVEGYGRVLGEGVKVETWKCEGLSDKTPRLQAMSR